MLYKNVILLPVSSKQAEHKWYYGVFDVSEIYEFPTFWIADENLDIQFACKAFTRSGNFTTKAKAALLQYGIVFEIGQIRTENSIEEVKENIARDIRIAELVKQRKTHSPHIP